MPSRSHKSDYAVLIGLGAMTGLCLAGFYTWGLLRTEEVNEPGVRTTHSTDADGTMATSILFARFGDTITASERPLLADSLAEIDALWVVDPLIPLNAAEVSALEQWVEDGGVLISTGIPGRLLRAAGNENATAYDGCISCRSYARNPSATAQSSSSTIPHSARHLPLAPGITQLRWMTKRQLDLDEIEALYPLLEDSVGVRIAARQFGKGVAILLADSSFLANGMIGAQDNSVLAMNLVRYVLSQADGRRVAYDEYHLGFGKYDSGMAALWRIMWTTSPGWAVASLTIAGLLYLLYKGRRFGTRREPGRPRRRSKMEFVQAIGVSFRTAGAHRLVWRLIYGSWKRKAAREAGLPATVQAGDLGATLARYANKPASAYHGLLERCENAAQQKKLSARELAHLVDRLARLEQETLNGHRGRNNNR